MFIIALVPSKYFMRDERFKLITVESDFGAGKQGAALGPQALIDELRVLNVEAIDFYSYNKLIPKPLPASTETPHGKNIEVISSFQQKVCDNVVDTLKAGKIPFIFSGDHSSANALISGVKDYYANQRIGVIWIDAHADLHSPYTTPSGNIHGMPLAALTGQDHREMGRNAPKEVTKSLWNNLKRLGRRNISPKILPEDLVFIALRSTEAEEEMIIRKDFITAYRPEHIKQLGIEQVAAQTLKQLRNCDYIYVSFDVDSLDSSISMGTGTPVEDGLTLEQAAYLLKTFIKAPNLAGFEITEVNPKLDEEKPMHKIIAGLLQKVLAE
ncbi:MAG: arginase [Bacteroidota bacterium]